jgi:enhancing lycopene biosynthesis protein 2
MKFAVLLHGCGVFDGTEIQEAVFSLLAIAQAGHEYQCIAPDIKQYHVIDHAKGEVSPEIRNVFTESARIARGNILRLSEISENDFDGLIMPGGFGTAKNLTTWAFEGASSGINPDVKNLIIQFIKARKPIVALCMSPTTLAKALEGSPYMPHLTVGSTAADSPYDIAAISAGIEQTGAVAEMKTVKQIAVDKNLKIVTAPCYMMEASITDVYDNIRQAIDAMLKL